MNESSDEPPLLHRIRSWIPIKAQFPEPTLIGAPNDHNSAPTLKHSLSQGEHDSTQSTICAAPGNDVKDGEAHQQSPGSRPADNASSKLPSRSPPAMAEKREGEESSTIGSKEKAPLAKRFLHDFKRIIFCSWINWLLIFVPLGIIVGTVERAQGENSAIRPTVVFAMNAIAIIPLASLLAFATENVATKMGDTIGALLNVTFGNAVELIVFIIALVANEIQIVQAAALGSILSNLLLILGMCFLFGGLRFREQVPHNLHASSLYLLTLPTSSITPQCLK